MVDAKAGEGDEPQEHHIMPFVAKTQDISRKTANITKWLENLRRKMRPQEAVKHLIKCSTTLVMKQLTIRVIAATICLQTAALSSTLPFHMDKASIRTSGSSRYFQYTNISPGSQGSQQLHAR